MAELFACLVNGAVLLVRADGSREPLHSPFIAELDPAEAATARIVSVSGGRRRGELYYVVHTTTAPVVLAQRPGTGEELRLFQGRGQRFRDVDFSFADTALACTLEGERGTSAIGLLADDGRGMHAVTEGDVLDREPHWVPGGVREIVYASTGIARTRAGERAGLSPSALHRLRFADSSVEVLVSDAKFDYFAPRQLADGSLLALRHPYVSPVREPLLARLLARVRRTPTGAPDAARTDLVHIAPKATRVLVENVRAFDGAGSSTVYATDTAVFRLRHDGAGAPRSEQIAELSPNETIEALVACPDDGA